MNKAMEIKIRKSLHIPEGELLTIWKLPGWRDCPLCDLEMGVTNCPLGFDTGGWSPNNPPAWMRDRLSEEVLAHCQQCQGKPQLTPEEAQISTNILEIVTGSGEVQETSTTEAKEDEG